VVDEYWWESWVSDVVPYALLIRLFRDEAMTADEFEILYLRLFKSDSTDWPDQIFDVLDGLFADVDSYCADDQLREKVHGLDSVDLRQKADLALAALTELAG
jgi:hypothetical protein